MNSWRECVINAEGIRKGDLFKFRSLCVGAFQSGGFPKEAAVFSEAAFEDTAKFWISPLAVQLLEKSGVDLSQWHAKESDRPDRNVVALLAGHHQLAWELLT